MAQALRPAGLAAALTEIQAAEDHGEVVVGSGRPEPGPPRPGATRATRTPAAADPAAIVAAITAQAGTRGYCAVTGTEVTAAGLSGALEILATTGGSCSYGYRMVSGSWFSKPGEIVVATPFLTATRTRIGDTVVLTSHGTRITARIVGEAFNTENDGLQLVTDATTLAAAEPDLRADTFHVLVRPGTDLDGYTDALNAALAPSQAYAMAVHRGTADVVLLINALTALLTLMLVAVAALGVLNTVVLETRERVHDLGVHKALGMAPRQSIAMVIASVVVTGLVGGALGTPGGVLLQRTVVRYMGHTAGFDLPAPVLDIYRPGELLLYCLGGLVIAVLGALLPAGWAARTRTATALRTE